MKVCIVGATGLVGSTMLKLLEERNFPVSYLLPVATERSKGRNIGLNNVEFPVCTLQEALDAKPRLVLFSAGSEPSLEWAPKFAHQGAWVIDNSSAWRMHDDIPLVVPEVNVHSISPDSRLIANPNCSTIQLVVALNPLHQAYQVRRVVVSTYQSVTGTGTAAVEQLMNERQQTDGPKVYPYPIDLNLLPHIDSFQPNGYTKEELKMTNETVKIMGDASIRLTATTVRVPVRGGHSESVNVEFEQEFDLTEVRSLLAKAPGVLVQDDPASLLYPMPLYAEGRDEVFVGRLRRDESQSRTLNMWVVSDNLRKGAATNAIQIAEYLLAKGWLS
jgi:aspartate-semialdehyde dehydrogenase